MLSKKMFAVLLLFLLAALCGYLGLRLYALDKAHAALAVELERAEHRGRLLQSKYTEQKAQTAAMQRARLTAEGLKRQAEMQVEELTRQVEAQGAEIAVLKQRSSSRAGELEARLAERQALIEQWKERFAQETEAHRQARKEIAERKAEIAALQESVRGLEAELTAARRTQERYRAHNREMAATAQSILVRYDGGGTFAKTLLKVEPFTQLGKVQLEQTIQQYLDDIDHQTIRE
jgi:chromosome segregation ATPase